MKKKKQLLPSSLAKQRQKAYELYLSKCNTKCLKSKDDFISLMNGNKLFFDLNDITNRTIPQELRVECEVLSHFFYWTELLLTWTKSSPLNQKRSKTPTTLHTAFNKLLLIEEESKKMNQLILFKSLSRNLSLTAALTLIQLSNLHLTYPLSQALSQGIKNNKSIEMIQLSQCSFDSSKSTSELLFSLAQNVTVIRIDITNCSLGNQSPHLLHRIISCHTYSNQGNEWVMNLRRGLRQSLPYYLSGLQILNLSNNKLDSNAAKEISQALFEDNFIHSIDVSSNCFQETDCNMFIFMLRTNSALINCDLRFNPGYSFKAHSRVALKLCRNVKRLKEEYSNRTISKEEYDALRAFANPELFQLNIIADCSNKDITFAQWGISNDVKPQQMKPELGVNCYQGTDSAWKERRSHPVMITAENRPEKREMSRFLNKSYSNSIIKANRTRTAKKNESFSMTMSNTENIGEKDKEHLEENSINKVSVSKIRRVIKDLNQLLYSLNTNG